MNLNKAIIIGRLTRDPEIRTTPSGQQVASFGVATNRIWKNADGEKQKKTEFHNIVAWGKLGEICGQYLSKGQEIYIEGRIETRNWESQDGTRRNRTEIIAENMQMGQRPSGEGGEFTSSFSPDYSNSVKDNSIDSEKKKSKTPVIQTEKPVDKSKNGSNEEEIRVEDIPF